MNLSKLLARDLLPDFLIRFGIRRLLRQRLAEITAEGDTELGQARQMELVESLKSTPIAIATDEANEQHYELPAEFFRLVLGPNRKYSSAIYPRKGMSLAEAEEAMLSLTCERAQLEDGQQVLELGCGWGSLTLFMARRYPNSRIVGVSNSNSQRLSIMERARAEGLQNVEIITADINLFEIDERFDRIVSVEMFEHVRNYSGLFDKIHRFLEPDGRLFVHIFTHYRYAYPFDVKDESDWMAKYFFTGGMMPSHHFFFYFSDRFRIDDHWTVNGRHYQQTSEDWLKNMDRHRKKILPIFKDTYGDEYRKWWAYWRIFFMAVAELFGYSKGREWQVSHYRFAPVPIARQNGKHSARPAELQATSTD